MEAVLKLGKLTHPLIKLLGFKSFVHATASAGADKRFSRPLSETDTGNIGPLFHALAWTFADKASYRLRELINKKDYGFQRGLQRAYQSALASTLAGLEERSLQEHQDVSPVTVAAFFEYLKVDYSQQEQLGYTEWEKVIDAFAHWGGDIFEKVSEAVQLDPALPEAEVLRSFIDNFPGEMGRAFLEQLVNPEHDGADLLYIPYLVDSYLRDELRIQKVVLREASRLLEKIAALPAAGQLLREEAQRLLESVNEAMNERVYDSDEPGQELASVASETSPPLPLYLPGDGMDSEAPEQFHWQEAAPSFVGQARELKDLHDFVRIEDRAFHWGAIVGPSGIGKRRIAVEACRQIRKLGFTAGFLRTEHLGLLADYQPQNPTLVVIDGIAAVYREVIEVIEHLYERRRTNPLARNLRLLLLDRNVYDSWWRYFRTNPRVSQSSADSCIYLRTDHTFFGMDEKERWHIVREVYQERRKGDIPYPSGEVLKELVNLLHLTGDF